MAATASTQRQIHIPPIKFLSALKNPPDLPNQIIAGITLAALMIPLNIGYAQVAGLPPIVGLYASIVPMVLWGLFATSRNLVAGPDAPVAALIGSLLAGFALTTDPRYIELAYAQALVTAVVFFLAWFFQLGFVANFLSKAVWLDLSAAWALTFCLQHELCGADGGAGAAGSRQQFQYSVVWERGAGSEWASVRRRV